VCRNFELPICRCAQAERLRAPEIPGHWFRLSDASRTRLSAIRLAGGLQRYLSVILAA